MEHFAGLDVSVKETSVCIVDDTGRMSFLVTNFVVLCYHIKSASVRVTKYLDYFWMTWPIVFSSLIGCSFIVEEAANPESAKDSLRYRHFAYRTQRHAVHA